MPERQPSLEAVLEEAETKMMGAVEVLEKDLKGVRTGRANPALLDGIRADYYGQPTPISQMATVSVPEPKLIVIRPWDQSALPAVEKAILASSLGLQPQSDKGLIRLVLPPLSEERRRQLSAHVKERGETAKVAIRNVRRDANRQVDDLKKAGRPEDDCFKAKESVQKLTEDYEKEVDKYLAAKTRELMET